MVRGRPFSAPQRSGLYSFPQNQTWAESTVSALNGKSSRPGRSGILRQPDYESGLRSSPHPARYGVVAGSFSPTKKKPRLAGR